MEKLIKKLAACMGVFNHSAVKDDELQNIQMLHEELQHSNMNRSTTNMLSVTLASSCFSPFVCYFDP